MNTPLASERLDKMNAYWRAANCLSGGQMHPYDNPLLTRLLTLADMKRMLLGHWGTTPGQSLIYAHVSRVITEYDLEVIDVAGPGHGCPAVVGNAYLEGTYSEIYPDISHDEAGRRKCLLPVSCPSGLSSHVSPETPDSVHEGGELGYSLRHSFEVALESPGLVIACIVGDGEVDTGTLATAWQSNEFLDSTPDGVVLACCGDVPTLETLAAVSLLCEHLPELKIRAVNVIDLMKLQPESEHPHGPSDIECDDLFTRDKPVIFAFHGYPWLIHRLTYRRTNRLNLHVRGYKIEGTITTPFDMTVLNDLGRFHLLMDTIDRLPQTGTRGLQLKKQLQDQLIEHRQSINTFGEDMPDIRYWQWGTTDARASGVDGR